MTTTPTRLLYILISFTIGYLPMGASPMLAQADCKVILDAAIKVLNTPAHIYTTGKIGGTTVNSEMIYAGGTVYMRMDGKWISAGTTKDLEQTQKKQSNTKVTCHYLKDDVVNGEIAAVYSLQSPGVVDSQIWISKAKGLTLRTEDDIGAASNKQHNSTRYEYGNVKPPL
jgi:hypothetical protein